MTQPALSVIIPAYNEASRLAPSLGRVANYFGEQRLAFEILVVDDGSTDRTTTVARAAEGPIRLVELGRNRGKGAAVRAGVRESRGTHILFTDADLSTPIEQWLPLQRKLQEGYDLVVGSRGLADSRIERRQRWYRERMGKTFNWILRHTLPIEITDTQCGFKLFEATAAKRLFEASRIDGFAFDAEILFLAGRFGYRVGELPVPWFDSVPSRVHPLWHSGQMLKDLFRIRLFALTGAYEPRKAKPSVAK